VRKILVISAMAAAMAPLLVQPVSTQAGPEAGKVEVLRRSGPPKGPIPRLPDGTVDLGDGVWTGGGPIGNMEENGGLPKGTLDKLMLPWAKALVATRDPSQEPHNVCLPMGVPRVTPFPYRFVQNYTHKKPTHMFILHEGNIHTFRQIFMDGRKHPAELDPSWLGHSIGWWEKDTLVIDTRGYNDKFWFDRVGHPHTEQLHTVERWTRLSLGQMENKVLIDDPGAYTKSFELKFMATFGVPGDELLEYICQENNPFGQGTLPGYKGPALGNTPQN
jgi:hypothetical protein